MCHELFQLEFNKTVRNTYLHEEIRAGFILGFNGEGPQWPIIF